jgi:hypothetical protein
VGSEELPLIMLAFQLSGINSEEERLFAAEDIYRLS